MPQPLCIRKSACSFVSTPSARVLPPIFWFISTTEAMMLRERGVSSFRKAMSIFKTSKLQSFKRFRVE